MFLQILLSTLLFVLVSPAGASSGAPCRIAIPIHAKQKQQSEVQTQERRESARFSAFPVRVVTPPLLFVPLPQPGAEFALFQRPPPEVSVSQS